MGLVLLETWTDSPVTLRGFYNHCQKQLINPTAIRVLWRHPGPNEDIYVLLWSPPLWPRDWAGNPRCYKPTNCDFYFLPVTPNLGFQLDLTQLGSRLMSNGLKKNRSPTQIILWFYDSVKSSNVKRMFHMGLPKSWSEVSSRAASSPGLYSHRALPHHPREPFLFQKGKSRSLK